MDGVQIDEIGSAFGTTPILRNPMNEEQFIKVNSIIEKGIDHAL